MSNTVYESSRREALGDDDAWVLHFDWLVEDLTEPMDLLVELARRGSADALDELRRELGPARSDLLFDLA